MENQPDAANPNAALITTFCEITSAAPAEAQFYLESHNFDLSSALSTFLESADPEAQPGAPNVPVAADPEPEPYSPSQSSSPSRSRSPSPTPGRREQYNLRSSTSSKPVPDAAAAAAAAAGSSRRRGVSGVRTLSDLNRRSDGDTDSDEEPQAYYTGGEKSGMLVQDPTKGNDVNAIYEQARQAGGVEMTPEQAVQPSSRPGRFTGTARLLSGETVPQASPQQPPASISHNIYLWRNGFSVDEDGPLRRFDDPANVPFLESLKRSECPEELQPANRRTAVHCNLVRKDANYTESPKPAPSFQGVGRTIGGENDATPVRPAVVASPPTTSSAPPPPPTTGLIVDQALPSTSIQLRLADGTRMVSRFNYHHTLRDIRGFIDASRPGGSREYLLQTVGFPPKQLTDLDQTVEQAGLANSVVIQKL